MKTPKQLWLLLLILAIGISMTGCPSLDGVPGPGEGETQEGELQEGESQEGEDTLQEGEAANASPIEKETFDLVNGERTSRGFAALTMTSALNAVARAHSEDMVARDFFAHTNPDGLSPFQRMAAAGILYSAAAENIAWNNFPNPPDAAVTGWMDSAGHRASILNGIYTHTGMGVASDGDGGFYFTQVFTLPR